MLGDKLHIHEGRFPWFVELLLGKHGIVIVQNFAAIGARGRGGLGVAAALPQIISAAACAQCRGQTSSTPTCRTLCFIRHCFSPEYVIMILTESRAPSAPRTSKTTPAP